MDDAEFERLSAEILDGATPDWEQLERETPPAARARLEALRAIAQVSAASRAVLGQRTREKWGAYELTEPVGHGGYGEVWRAHDPQLARDVALKIIPAEDEDVEDVLREGRMLARVRHPHVATVYGASHVGGEIGVAMEFVDGEDLDTIVRRDGPLAPREVTTIGLQLARAIEAVHRAGVLHRDIKASNVKRTEDGRAILLDFGSSRELRLHTANADEAGTPLYVAPEVLAGGAATVQSDLYGLGVLLYFLATGRHPIEATSFEELRAQHTARRRSAVALDDRTRLPRNLASVLNQLLAPAPERRPRTAAAVAARLSRRWPRYATAAGLVLVGAISAAAFSMRFVARSSGFAADPTATSRRLEFAIAPATIGHPSRDGRVLPFVDRRNGGLAIMHVDSGAIDVVIGGSGMLDSFAGASAASPDGQQIAYQWHGDAVPHDELRIIDLGSRATRAIWRVDDDTEIRPTAWSSDGTRIAGVLVHSDGRQDVFVLPLANPQQPTVIAGRMSDAPTFNDDGGFLVFQDTKDGQPGNALWVVDLPSGVPRPLGITSGNDSAPIWSGNRVLFVSDRGGSPQVWMVRVDSSGHADGVPVAVPDTPGVVDLLGMTADGSLLARRGEGTSQVIVANLDGSSASEVSSGPGAHFSPDWSPDGEHLAYVTEPPGPFVHILRIRDLVSGQERAFNDLARSTGTPGRIGMNPRFSPDGNRVLLRGIKDGSQTGFFVADLVTGGESQLYLRNRTYRDVEWDDLTHVVFGEMKRGIVRLDLVSRKEELLFAVPYGSTIGRGIALTPDKSRIAFVLEDAGVSTAHVMVMNRDGSAVRELYHKSRPRPYGGVPMFAAVPLLLGQWTADGRELLFASTEILPNGYTKWDTALWAIPATGQPPHATGLRAAGLRDIRVDPNGGRVAYSMFTVHTETLVMPRILQRTDQIR